MAKKYYSEYTAEEIEDILKTSDEKPFVLYYDKDAQVYRFFRSDEKLEAWLRAQESEEGIPPEIAAYEFTSSFTAPAPYSIVIDGLEDNLYILKGTKNNYLTFDFRTIDGNGIEYGESIAVYYTFKTSEGSRTITKTYNKDTQVKLKIDDYLSVGTNNITLFVRGLSTKATKIEVRNYYLVELDIQSTFDISKPISGSSIRVPYSLRGQGERSISLYIDGSEADIHSYSADTEDFISGTFIIPSIHYNPGVHRLQLTATSRGQFYSKSLYFEFVISGSAVDPTVLIKYEFPPTNGESVIINIPILTGEQYVSNILDWVYYYENPDLSSNIGDSAIITWTLRKTNYSNVLSSITATSALSFDKIEELIFIPLVFGNYELVASIGDSDIKTYSIVINKNKYGLEEASNSLILRLSGIGRNNSEPKELISKWEYTLANKYSTTFYNQPWNSNSGWNNNALVLNDGATAEINLAPFDTNIIDVTTSGCVIEIDFETFNIHDNDAVLIKIGDSSLTNKTQLIIKPSIATLTSRNGVQVIARYKSDERIKLAFVIYPQQYSDPTLAGFMFLYCNGVLSNVNTYVEGDSFYNSSNIKLGNAIVNGIQYNGSEINSITGTGGGEGETTVNVEGCGAGIKIYYLRVYASSINMYQELNNFIIDQNDSNTITELAEKNDLFSSSEYDSDSRRDGDYLHSTLASKIIDVDKLRSLITTVEITGDLVANNLIGSTSKQSMYGGLRINCTENPTLNMHCDRAYFSSAGQSTLDKPVPSLHVKLDKDKNNVCYDDNDRPLPKNRWTFREGNVPEKKFRLQANYMDSSCAHNAAFMRLFNEVSNRVTIGNENVLQIPAIKYANKYYSGQMQADYGDDPNGNNWKFPYNLHMVPDSIPCVVIWREDEQSAYRYLGQYVLMEEKKSNFSNGMRSIYNTIDNENNPDPFQFKKKDSGSKIWNNSGCHQFELLTSTDDLTLFLNTRGWDDIDLTKPYGSGRYPEREKNYEIIYPDPDDLLEDDPNGGLIDNEWNLFYNNFLSPICNSRTQEEFDTLYNTIFDRYQWAAYYCLALRNCCSDSFARNIEVTTYDGGIHWLPKWWDVDMQCGLHQTGACNIDPPATRDTKVANNTTYALSGRILNKDTGELEKSSWLWDGLENCEQFRNDVQAMDKALYAAGWTYYNINRIMDEEYVNKWSQILYNYSSVSKYLDYAQVEDNLVSLQGDRTPHRHWFLRTSYDYFDAINVCGEFLSKTINVRTEIPKNITFTIKAGIDSYFGWGTSISNDETGVLVTKGENHTFNINRALQLNNPLHIFGASKIQELDMSNIAQYMASNLDFTQTYDSVTGTYLRKLNIGIKDEDIQEDNIGTFNEYDTFKSIGGLSVLEKVEEFSVQGLYYLERLNLENLRSLKKFKAKGTNITYFKPADGCNLSLVELPDTVRSLTLNECSLTKQFGEGRNYDSCSISWFRTVESENTTSINIYYIYSVIYDQFNAVIDEGWQRWEPENEPSSVTYYISSFSQLENLPTSNAGDTCKLTIQRKIKIIESLDSIPSTVTSLYFRSMGEDIGTQELIENWLTTLQDIPNLNDYSITYTNISWGGKKGDDQTYVSNHINDTVHIDLLKTLARIPSSQRNISGYIRARGTGENGAFTSEEINFLLRSFGPNIFNINNSLCIDGVSGDVLISATGLSSSDEVYIDENGKICITQGSKAQLTATGFPIAGNISYKWGYYRYSNPNYADDDNPVLNINDVSEFKLYKNGLITTEECSQSTINFKIVVVQYIEDFGSNWANIDVTIKPRNYPTKSSIELLNNIENNVILNEGGIEISKTGKYDFKVNYEPAEFDGSLLYDSWNTNTSFSDYTGNYSFSHSSLEGNQTLWVNLLPESQIIIPLSNVSFWKNGMTLQSNILTVSIVNNDNILTRIDNSPLFNIFSNDVGIFHVNPGAYTAIELKTYVGNINVSEGIDANNLLNFECNNKNVLSYLSNVEILNVENCENLTGDVDISIPGLKFREIILNENSSSGIILPDDNTSIEKLILGKPNKIKIHNPSNDITTNNKFSINSSENLMSLELKNIKNKTFRFAANIIIDNLDSEGINSKVNPGFNHVNLYQNKTTTEIITPDQINRIASLCSSDILLDNTSIMIGKLQSSTNYVYQSSKDAILNRFNINTIGVEKNIDIIASGYYLEFIDEYFRRMISYKWGDTFGLKPSEVENITTENFKELRDSGDISLVKNIKGIENLTSITFPDLENQEDSPFLGYSNLTTAYFPSNLVTLGRYTFNGNNKLVNINFNGCSSLRQIKENAFYNCTGKAIVDLSDCINLGSADLRSLTNLEQLTIIGDSNNTITSLKL